MKNELDEKSICDKISEASESDELMFGAYDRYAINEQIACKLPARKKHENRKFFKKFLPLAVCLCLIIGSTTVVLSFTLRGSASADPDIVENVSASELRAKFPDILLLENADYNLSSGQLVLSSSTHERRFAEMIYTSDSDKITLYVLLDADYNLTAVKDFPPLTRKMSVNDLQIAYEIKELAAYAHFAHNYAYYMIFESAAPESITEVLEYII